MDIKLMSFGDYDSVYGLWNSTEGIGSALVNAVVDALKKRNK